LVRDGGYALGAHLEAWNVRENERLDKELAEARKGEAFSDRVATHWQTEGHRLERENTQMRAALHRIIDLHDRVRIEEAQSIAESALQSEPPPASR
jgi:hypothetical protein